MKKGGGRAKGAAFERHVSKVLIAAFEAYGVTAEDCYRTPQSGGHRFARKEDPGDLVISKRLQKLFPFCVECKFYKKLQWNALLTKQKDKSHWTDWWDQAVTASNRQPVAHRYEPMLVCRQNFDKTLYAVLTVTAIADLCSETHNPLAGPHIETKLHGYTVRVVRLRDVLVVLKASAIERKNGKKLRSS